MNKRQKELIVMMIVGFTSSALGSIFINAVTHGWGRNHKALFLIGYLLLLVAGCGAYFFYTRQPKKQP